MKTFSSLLVALLLFTVFQFPAFAESHGEPPVVELEQQFQDLFYQETTEEGQVINFDTKSALSFEFRSIMTWPLADYYVDTWYYEENGQLYLEATEGPLGLDPQQEYTLTKITDDHYQLTQETESELYGNATLTIDYQYEAGKWVFADRMEVIGNVGGGELPETATSHPLFILIGGALMLIGGIMVVSRRERTAL